MEQEKKTAGMPCPPCKSAPFSRAVKPAAQENAVQEAAAPLGAPFQYGGSAVGRTEKTPGFTGVDAAFACGFLAVGWLFWELQLLSLIHISRQEQRRYYKMLWFHQGMITHG